MRAEITDQYTPNWA